MLECSKTTTKMNLFTINRIISKNALKLKILYFPNIRRFYSNYYNTVPVPKNAIGSEEFDKYELHFQDVVEHLTTTDKVIVPKVLEYFKQILDYNVPGHEQATGPLVLSTFKYLAPPEKQTLENIRLTFIMGWVNDMIGNSFQIVDDIFDSSQTRAGKPCWYRNDGVGLKAIQHSAAIGDGAFIVMRKFLSGHPNYTPILELTEEMKFNTSLGQILDLMSEIDFKYFTKEKYRIATIYRGTYLAITHPVCTGMYLAGVSDQNLHLEVKAILEDIGLYFAAQNDILDCYGKPEIIGKHGSDMQVGKNTWLAARAVADANPVQKELFANHYGKRDVESQKVIYSLYDDLEIMKKFLEFEKENYKEIQRKIGNISEERSKKMLQHVLDVFYGKI